MFSHSLSLAHQRMEQETESAYVRYEIAAVNATLGNGVEAYLWLQRAIDAGWRDDRIGLIDPLFENLRQDQKFKEIMAEVRGMVDEMRKRVKEA